MQLVQRLGIFAFLLLSFSAAAGAAQPATRAAQPVDVGALQILPNHHPGWANPGNDAGPVPAERTMDIMTLVLARSLEQETSFESFLSDQLNPASPDYHHWLNSAEIAERFGPSEQDVARMTAWLKSAGLEVIFTSPSRDSIGFKGTAGSVNRAFNTTLKYYRVNKRQLMSVSSDPRIPAALAPMFKAIRGLYTIEDRPMVHARPGKSASPEITFGSDHYVGPDDFATIYNIPSGATGTGATIGIVGRSRTDFADFENFRSLTGSTFPNPTEIIPTAYGGVDPGPAQTAPITGVGVSDDQLEAELDVFRAGSVAPGANLLLVVTTTSGGDIGADTEYLVETDPAPAQAINISFGACESEAGPSGVNFWDPLFKTAAAKGISIFVAAGDAGASGCDSYFAIPPANPEPNSPNYICSSSYSTCLGGTEFNDTGDPGMYWSSSNGSGFSSATMYIPEGGWNEPLNGNSDPQAAASGGGVSTVIPTPAWQTGTGVPAARAGRYTPDIAFSSSGHDGYFGCLAAGGASCVVTNGQFQFEYFFGTSAAAPDMAGVAALLNQKHGLFQGNLNPQLYQLAAGAPSVFHDVTVATSGVSSCSVNTPSMCNNSIPSSTGLTGGQAGYLVTAGYDEVTGLGSLNIGNFLNSFGASTAAKPVFKPAAGTYASAQSAAITDATPGATIYYTTNGTTPGKSSSKYTAAIKVDATETIKAIAVATGYSNSAVASATYTIKAEVATPTFSPAAGTYTNVEKITVTDPTSGAVIYYTTNGTTPTTASTKYTAPFSINGSETIHAIGTAAGDVNSAEATATYTLIGSPSALSAPAASIATPKATLNAIVNTLGLAGSYYFKYGISSTALTSTTTKSALKASAAPVKVSTEVATLKSKTKYYFQVVVTTAGGTSSGSLLSFTTD